MSRAWNWLRKPILVSRLIFFLLAFVVLDSVVFTQYVLHWQRRQIAGTRALLQNVQARQKILDASCSASTASCARSRDQCAADLTIIQERGRPRELHR